jgi:hypothetical protein
MNSEPVKPTPASIAMPTIWGMVTPMGRVAIRSLVARTTAPVIRRPCGRKAAASPYTTKTRRELSDADIEALADEAERGYDVEEIKQRPRGRPLLGPAPAEVVPVRLEPDLKRAVEARAKGETAPSAKSSARPSASSFRWPDYANRHANETATMRTDPNGFEIEIAGHRG